MLLTRLTISNLKVRRVRAFLTIAAIALSVSLVVAVTSGYSSVRASAQKFLGRIMGTADASVVHKGDPHAGMPEAVVDGLRDDADVKRVTGRLEVENNLLDVHGKPLDGRPAQVIGIDRPLDTRIENLTVKSGSWFDTSNGDVAVIDQVAAEKLGVSLGEVFSLPGPNLTLKVKVVGIVQKPNILASKVQSVYLPLQTLQHFTSPAGPATVNRIMIDLRPSADLDAFTARWNKRLVAIDPSLGIRTARDNRQRLDNNLQGLKLLSYLGGAVSMLAATFIVFSALSMGVAERQRVLAMMRAVGMLRRQVATLVIAEGMIVGLTGVAVGVPLGILWVRALAWRFPKAFFDGVVTSGWGVLLGAGGSVLAAVVASLLPAWSATRVRPLEAMSPLAAPAAKGFPWRSMGIGLLLVSIDPLNTFLPWERLLSGHVTDPNAWATPIKIYGHFAYGLPALMLGFFLIAPAMVFTLERVAGPVLAVALGIRFALLRQQLSSGLWRAAGVCAALMVGLAILVGMEVQGTSMLRGWEIPDQFPDIFIVSWSAGLGPQQIQTLAKTPGIRPGELMPVAIASPQFGGNGPLAMLGMVALPDATMFFGIPPEQGMKMMHLTFHQGNPTDAVRMLNMGRHVIVTEEFYQLKHLGVGDKLPLKTTRHGVVDYTIAGVVWSPGMDVIVSMFDMGRQFDQRTAASVFGSISDAKEDFGADDIRLFAANLDYFTDKDAVLKRVQKELGVSGMMAGDVRQIKHDMQSTFADLLLLVSLVPFAATVVASLGVTNSIMASIRSRRWQFGVLRSVGLTRSQLVRVVLSEAAMIGTVGCALGIAAGSLLAMSARELTRVLVGYNPPLSIPWQIVGAGTALVFVIAILASVWPAVNVSRVSPLTLLQAGRAAS